jgi:hypothetical protein
MKILSVGDELFHAGGETDNMKLIIAFLSVANMPKNVYNKMTVSEPGSLTVILEVPFSTYIYLTS